ncbi:MAG: MaoC family dehydratase [Pseudomonadota bacterium]|jgi:itaconyl-CoA hydratase|nr:acyl dehydratase [Alphaproteobacteria bacterium]
MSLTGPGNYYEDFTIGDVYRHARGKTIMEYDNVATTLQVMNTAEGHFNEDLMSKSGAIFPHRVNFGGVTIATVVGLSMQDTGENALRELGMDKIRLKSPVFHGDTLYAYTEVLAKDDSGQKDAGVVHFKHYGLNQDGKEVFEGERRVLIRKRGPR